MYPLKKVAVIAAAVLLASAAGCRRSENNQPSGPAPPLPSNPPLSYAATVERVAHAVVTIRSSRRVRAPEQFPFFNDPFFRRFFGGSLPGPSGGTQVEQALGSGVVVRSDGHILTNHHVIDGAEDIKVDLYDHRTLSAKVVGSDPPSDLAVLKIDASNLTVLQLGNSDQARVGDIVLAIGNPLGIGQTVTSGIISAKGRNTGLSNGSFEDFIQTDAPINKGNSGGALINTNGELVGINSQIISTTGASIGIGFAIPSNMARNVMDQIISRGKVTRGQLGVSVQPITSDLAASLGLKQAQGVLVNSVVRGGPADQAGIKPGDAIIALNGNPVQDPNSFRNAIAGTAPGTRVTLTIMRNGQQQQVQATLRELSPQGNENAPGSGQGGTGGGELGITAQPLTPDIASQLGLPAGTQGLVVMSVDPTGPAADAGIQTGDVIQEINHQPVRSVADVRSALQKSAGRPALVLVNRGGQTLFVPVRPR
jgi:Do/DeqQ family serine protease